MPPTCKQDGSSACRNTTFYKHTGRRGTSVTICAPLNGGDTGRVYLENRSACGSRGIFCGRY